MERKAFLRLAASTLMITAALAGCSGGNLHTSAGGASEKAEKTAARYADEAKRALAAHKADAAVAAAENAVRALPSDADSRVLLGRAYLMNGRFASAQTAFEDAMALGNREPRTIVSLALVRIAQGRAPAARELLAANVATLPAADYGLGMAMAGDPDEAIRVLGQAIHDPSAGAKERQNLAYSYALAGRWTEARQIAEMDLAPQEAAKRVMDWATTSEQGADAERVFAMLGTRPVASDAGLPAALALGAAPVSQVAQNDSSAAPIAAPDYPTQYADPAPEQAPEQAAAPAPVDNPMANDPALAYAPPPPATSTPLIAAPVTPARQAAVTPIRHGRVVGPVSSGPRAIAHKVVRKAAPVRVARAAPVRTVVRKPAPKVAIARATVRPVARTVAYKPQAKVLAKGWVVQIAAYSGRHRPAVKIAGRGLSGKQLITTTARINGRTYQRIALTGFANARSAAAACSALQAQGRSCFVRHMGTPTNVRMASGGQRGIRPQQIARGTAPAVRQVAKAAPAKAMPKVAAAPVAALPKPFIREIASK